MGFSEKIGKVLVAIFGSRNERILREMLPLVEQVHMLEPKMQRLSDAELRAKTDELRDRLAHGETLDDLIPEAFAVAREASRRVIWTPDVENPVPMRHFDVQVIGGIVLHRGMIAEMATGEGKTLVATLAVYLNALEGKGVHIVTVNDYLARRDRDWMGPLYEFLGMTGGVIQNMQDFTEKKAAYQCDVTFGRDSEFGFDYLRDNMRTSVGEQVQRGLNFAIVDEVDSVLIDEARTPLIISGAAEESTEKYYQADRVARRLQRAADFEIKEKDHVVYLTEDGTETVEDLLGVDNIYAGRNADWPHYIEQALRAHHLYKRDVDYVSKGGEILIVDEFTGRLMPGRRWSDGLHQAIEAKEHLRIKEENQTLATITYQNYFRMYRKLAGMTGTAMTEADEFAEIYKLDAVTIPTNRPLIRTGMPDVVFGSEPEKFDAIEEEIVRQHATGRPLLVGTISIEKSEYLSGRLGRRGIRHEVLNAKHHEREAQIIAKAGQLANLTIATNMAGRGTDIVLGTMTRPQIIEHWQKTGLAPRDINPNAPEEQLNERLLEHWARYYLDEKTLSRIPRSQWQEELERYWRREGLPALRLTDRVADLGGLHVVGTERHEARRIDNQLRGRAGRQGDPGSSRFFLSLEDDLMRIFAPERVTAILRRIGMSEGMAIEHPLVTRSIERAQRKVEEHNFEIRKHLLEYDEVMDEQRKRIYGQRQQILEKKDIKDAILDMIERCLHDQTDLALPSDEPPERRSFRSLADWAGALGASIELEEWRDSDYAKLRALFAQRAAKAALASPQEADGRSAVAALVARHAMLIYCQPDEPFTEWDLAGLENWMQGARVPLPAEAIRARITDAVVRRCVTEARARYEAAELNSLLETLVEDAAERFLPLSSAPPEWDLEGIGRWASTIGVSLPVSQWRLDEPDQEEGADFEQSRREEIRARILEKGRAQLKDKSPADIVAKLVEARARGVLTGSSDEEGTGDKPAMRLAGKPLAIWLSRALDVHVSEAEIRQAVEEETQRIQHDLARRISEVFGSAESCMGSLFDAFMLKDLAAPERDLARLANYVRRKYGVEVSPFDLSKLTPQEIADRLLELVHAQHQRREERLGADNMRLIECFLLLTKMDIKWKDHLYAMDHLKAGIGLRGYAQLDPKVEYTREARQMFDEMQVSLHDEVTDLVLRIDIKAEETEPVSVWRETKTVHPEAAEAARFERQQARAVAGSEGSEEKLRPIVSGPRVGRNEPCPCGSGRKYKNCCGKGR